jgi:hypothetical protein
VSESEAPRPKRRDERESLLNPAFIAIVLAHVVKGHLKRAERPLPISLAFLAAPIVLHGPTREALPTKATSRVGGWLDQNPVLRAGFANRASMVRPAVQAGVRMGLRADVLELEDGMLTGSPPRRRKALRWSQEVEDILKRAGFVGGWLALAGPPAGLYALWGVRP